MVKCRWEKKESKYGIIYGWKYRLYIHVDCRYVLVLIVMNEIWAIVSYSTGEQWI